MSKQEELKQFCASLDEWAKLRIAADHNVGDKNGFDNAWREVRSAISKSCLLSRTIYGGEKPSKTPCPVHEGRWSGIQIGWPGQKWSDGSLMEPSEMLGGWYERGCRCFMHNACGCTTGWQPDEHCGCGVKP